VAPAHSGMRVRQFAGTNDRATTEGVQLGVRLEKNIAEVLKGLAEFNDETLGELLQRIVMHSFDPVCRPWNRAVERADRDSVATSRSLP
jgi:hypothetical protein